MDENATYYIDSRLRACWKSQDCYGCTHNARGCGWCPTSATCVPVTGLLDPVAKPDICPLKSERFELRTKGLGCGCSTTTLLSVIVTVFSTIAALAILYGIVLAAVKLNEVYGTGAYRGWEIETLEDGSKKGKPWARPTVFTKAASKLQRENLSKRSEQEEVTERSRLLA